VKRITILLVTVLMAALLAPSVMAQENRDLWSFSTYVQSAKIIYQHEYKKNQSREIMYKAIDLMKEAGTRFRYPEAYFMLGSFYAEIDILDTMVMCFDSVDVLCADPTVDEKARKKCEKDKYTKKMNDLRQDYWEKAFNDAVKYLKQYDAVDSMAAYAPADSAHYYDSLQTYAFETVRRNFEQAILVKPSEPRSYDGLGILYQRRAVGDALEKNNREAIKYYKKAMEVKGENKEDVSRIAYAYIAIPDWGESIVWFDKLLTYEPNDASALINLSICYSTLNEFDKSYEYLLKLLEVEPNNAQGNFNAGQYWFRKMQDINASIAEISDSTTEAEAKRAELEGQLKEATDKATGFYSKAIESDSTDTNAMRLLGILYLLSGKNEEAIDVFQKHMAINDNDATVLDYLGRAYIQEQKFVEAIKIYEKLVDNDPGNADNWHRLAELYKYNKQLDKAAKAEAKAKELDEL